VPVDDVGMSALRCHDDRRADPLGAPPRDHDMEFSIAHDHRLPAESASSTT